MPPTPRTKTKTPSKKKSRLKKAFDLPRDSIYSVDPFALRICGARGVVPEDEAGPLDTPPGPDVPVRDARRMRRPLSPQFAESIHLHGVDTPVIIAKIDGVPTVLVGKRRVRGARKSAPRRAEEGRGKISVKCVMNRDVTATKSLNTTGIKALIIRENNNREGDTLADRVEKLKSYLADGPSEYDASIEFGVDQSRIRELLAYDDNAAQEVKDAVEAEQISASTGLELSRMRSEDAQRVALTKLLGGAKPEDRSARAARALARGENHLPTATDKKSQRLLLAYLQAPVGQSVRHRSDRPEFWRGVQEALKIVTGQETEDAELRRALTVARSQSATASTSTAASAPAAKDAPATTTAHVEDVAP